MARSNAQDKIAAYVRGTKFNADLTFDEIIPLITKACNVRAASVDTFFKNGGMEQIRIKGRAVPEMSAVDAIRAKRALEAERIMASKAQTPELVEMSVAE